METNDTITYDVDLGCGCTRLVTAKRNSLLARGMADELACLSHGLQRVVLKTKVNKP